MEVLQSINAAGYNPMQLVFPNTTQNDIKYRNQKERVIDQMMKLNSRKGKCVKLEIKMTSIAEALL